MIVEDGKEIAVVPIWKWLLEQDSLLEKQVVLTDARKEWISLLNEPTKPNVESAKCQKFIHITSVIQKETQP